MFFLSLLQILTTSRFKHRFYLEDQLKPLNGPTRLSDLSFWVCLKGRTKAEQEYEVSHFIMMRIEACDCCHHTDLSSLRRGSA